jgi:hypothetical protein
LGFAGDANNPSLFKHFFLRIIRFCTDNFVRERMDVRFVTWNVRSLYSAGSFTAAAAAAARKLAT